MLSGGGAMGAEGEGTENVLGPVAVPAEGLEAGREVVLDEPLVKLLTTRALLAFSERSQMFGTPALDMVDGEEDANARVTAHTGLPIGGEYGLSKSPPGRPLPSFHGLVVVGFEPLRVAWFAPRLPCAALSEKLAERLRFLAGTAASVSRRLWDLVIGAAWPGFVAAFPFHGASRSAWPTNGQATIRASDHRIDVGEVFRRRTPGCARRPDRAPIFRFAPLRSTARFDPPPLTFATIGTHAGGLWSLVEGAERNACETARAPSVARITGGSGASHSLTVVQTSSEVN